MNIDMSRTEAVALTQAVANCRVSLVLGIGKVKRMRAIRESAKAMELAKLRRDLDTLARFQEALEKAYGLGGY